MAIIIKRQDLEIKLFYTLYPIIRRLVHRDLKFVAEIGDMIYMTEKLESIVMTYLGGIWWM